LSVPFPSKTTPSFSFPFPFMFFSFSSLFHKMTLHFFVFCSPFPLFFFTKTGFPDHFQP
jgi:hypothetical protein